MANGTKVGGIYYSVDADTSPLVNSNEKLDDALKTTQKQFKTTDAAAAKSGHQLRATAQAAKQLGDEARAAQNPLGGMSKLLAGMATVSGAMGLVTMAEQYGEMAERIRMATASAQEYENVQARLLDTANATYRPLKEAQELYILTADSLRSMGYSTDQAIDVVDSMSFSFVKNATSAERSKGAISAFTGAIMTGKLEADAWKTTIAAIPTIVSDLAASTGMGAAEIRKMGAEGKITAQMLSEGLRKSLDENKEAAAGMATTVKDAFTAANNALSVYVGEANMANGTTALLSKAILLFADNLDTVVTLLTALGAGALAKYIAGTTAAAVSSGRAAIAARVQAAEELKLAAAHAASATAAASNASTNALLGGTHTAAARAADVQAAAEVRLAAAKKAAQAAGVGLIGVLGGPAGIIALAASAAAAIYLFGTNSRAAAPSVDMLTDSIDKLSAAQLENRKLQAQDAIDGLKQKAQAAGGAVKALEKDYEALNAQMQSGRGGVDNEGLANVKRSLVEAKAESDGTVKSLQEAYDAYNTLASAQASRKTSSATGSPVKQTADPEVTKRLAQMREELELAKLSGEARARLQAIQRLGTNATAEERAEAEKLASQIHALENARKGAGKATKDQKKAQDELAKAAEKELEVYVRNGEQLQAMAEKLALLQLEGKELAITQAALAMGAYATPEQIEAAKMLGAALFDAETRAGKLKEMGENVGKWISGDNKPLSGGEFDNQTERYDQEATVEQERYAGQLERLTQAMELEKLTRQEYLSTFETMQIEHNGRMDAIDSARTSVMRKQYGDAFGAVADILKTAQGEQSSAYRAMFAVSKAFAVADATVNAYNAVSKAWASAPFPANLGAVAATTPQVMGVVSAISGVGISGGRQYGGNVSAGNMYRINETGAPEVFNGANGGQYMLANQRGEVVSNADATQSGGGGVNVTVNINEDAGKAGTVDKRESDGQMFIDVWVANVMSDGEAASALENKYGLSTNGR